MEIGNIIKDIKSQLVDLLGIKFENLKDESKKDVQEFMKSSEEKLKRWTTLLAEGKLTPEDFKWLVESQKDMVVLKGLYAAGVSKIKLGHLKNKILSIVIDNVLGKVLK